MKVITVATHSQAYFPVLEESARLNNIELIVLGWGEKWGGFGWKLKLLKNYFQTQPPNEIVIVVDGFDTFIISNLDEIIQKFKEINKPMICAAERKHHNYIWNIVYERIFNKRNSYPQTPTIYNYLNAGAWITSSGYILDLLKDVPLHNTTNDQALFTYLYINEKIAIDYECKIFTCIRNESDLLYTNGRYENIFTKEYSCIIHAPADVSMKNLIHYMGYTPVKYYFYQRVWKYLYSIFGFWGNELFKQEKP